MSLKYYSAVSGFSVVLLEFNKWENRELNYLYHSMEQKVVFLLFTGDKSFKLVFINHI